MSGPDEKPGQKSDTVEKAGKSREDKGKGDDSGRKPPESGRGH